MNIFAQKLTEYLQLRKSARGAGPRAAEYKNPAFGTGGGNQTQGRMLFNQPRSVHPHFQGSCVVFALLICIARGRLTEQLAFTPVRLCDSAESGLTTSRQVGGEPMCRTSRGRKRLSSRTTPPVSASLSLTHIVYHKRGGKSMTIL